MQLLVLSHARRNRCISSCERAEGLKGRRQVDALSVEYEDSQALLLFGVWHLYAPSKAI